MTLTTRTPEQTQIGIFWAYDGTPSLCAPPRLYNQITMRIAHKMGTDTDALELARLLALVNVAMADAGIAVVGIQILLPVLAAGDRHSRSRRAYRSDRARRRQPVHHRRPDLFTARRTGQQSARGRILPRRFRPIPPAMPCSAGRSSRCLRNFYRTDRIPFTFVSDEFNGVTKDNRGNVRPVVTRSFSSLSQAEEENGQSRIYLGIHWAFDATEGIKQGNRVADYVFKNMLRPHHRR